ncbi:MAG: potassium uptake protein TrkH family [Gammaproteobacteria bacterium]|jgi:trk system potassium uptake protein TrkH|nr:potassium uptake protein TrkH family [Gammaproteobacteria bacterium]
MQILIAFRWISLLLMGFSLSMLTPLIIVLIYHEHDGAAFIQSAFITFLTGFIGWLIFRRYKYPVTFLGSFFIAAAFWFIFSAFSALPFLISTHHHMSFSDSIYETVSGFTTTSASVITNLDALPKSLLYYRQQLEFFGGMGMLSLAIALMRHLNIGSAKKLYFAEAPDPTETEDIFQAHVLQAVRQSWGIYALLTLTCAVVYYLLNMPLLDAICMSFSTVSTGGFVPHDANFNYFHRTSIMLAAEFFMLVGALNFNLHLQAFQTKSLKVYWKDTETRVYFALIFIAMTIVSLVLLHHHFYATTKELLEKASLNTISIMSTSGFYSAPFASWPSFVPFLLILLMLIGTPGNSTGGGLKVLRFWVMLKAIFAEMKHLISPQENNFICIGKHLLAHKIVHGILVFFCVYASWIVVAMLLLIHYGIDLESAFGLVAGCLSNAGLGLGKYAYSSAGISAPVEWILSITMIAGRLEIFPLLCLFAPGFWRNKKPLTTPPLSALQAQANG